MIEIVQWVDFNLHKKEPALLAEGKVTLIEVKTFWKLRLCNNGLSNIMKKMDIYI